MLALQDIFQIWPTLADMARDIGQPYDTVAKWSQRGRIPSDAWGTIIQAGALKGKLITWDELAAANKPRKQTASA